MLTCELVTFRQSKANIFPCFKSLCSAKLTAVCLPESVILISLNFCQQSNYRFKNIKIVYTGVANSWKANRFSTVKVNQAFLWWIVPPYLCLCTTSALPYGGFECNEIADNEIFLPFAVVILPKVMIAHQWGGAEYVNASSILHKLSVASYVLFTRRPHRC